MKFWAGFFRLPSAVLILISWQQAVAQQELDLSTDNLSFVEQPLAYEVGGFTLLLNGLFDLSTTEDFDTDQNSGRVSGVLQLSAERQLKNALTVGATYRGEEDRDNEEDFALFVRGIWGILSAGNVTQTPGNATEQMEGTGNADLTLNNFYGTLNDAGIAYSGRFSAYTLVGAIDDDGSYDLGLIFERPLNDKDYRFTGRFIDSEFTSVDGMQFDSTGFTLLGEIIYGSLLTDLSLGIENLDNGSVSFDRQFLSAELFYKHNRWTFSLEGYVGEIGNQNESGYAFGTRYDIARGLSVNFGLNYRDSGINLNGIQLTAEDTNEATVSLRYEL